ncbi:cytochrome c [Paracoccaceae bacterium Fryx2]|nr:cytochrome c [Paracoccaceae bacterium Fryx2]
MNLISKTLVAGLVLAAGAAFAKEGVQDPTVKARMDLMSTIGMNLKTLGDMAGDKTPFDAAAAETAKAALIAASADIPVKFEPEAEDPVSEAMPDIWMTWDVFLTKADTLDKAAAAMDVASVDGIKAGMGAMGEACKDCHTTFRMKK